MPSTGARGTGGRLARLTSLVEATQLLNSTLDLDQLLGVILDLAQRNLHASRGTIYLIDHERGELWSKVLKDATLVEIRLPIGTGIAGHVALSGETVNLRDATRDARFFADIDRRSGFHTRTMLCMPMRNRGGQTIGVFQMLNKRSGPFTRSDEAFLQAFSDHVALAIENARHHQAEIERQRAEKEMQIAARIQESLLPRETVAVPGYEVCASARPCRTVGGDYYTLIPLGEGRTLISVADVAGKGVPAALLVSMLHAALHVARGNALDLPALVTRLNTFVHENIVAGRYITAYLAVLDADRHCLTGVNAGHLPPLLVARGSLRALELGGLPLGLMPGSEYESQTVAVEPAELLVLYTDGVTEATSPADEEYGAERLERCLRGAYGLPAHDVHARVLEDVRNHAAGTPLADDLTLLVLRRQA